MKITNIFSRRSSWSLPYVVFLLLFVALPLILIMVYAFFDEGGNFTLSNLARFFSDSDALSTPPFACFWAILWHGYWPTSGTTAAR